MPVAQRRTRKSQRGVQEQGSAGEGVQRLPERNGSSTSSAKKGPTSAEDLFSGGSDNNLLDGKYQTAKVFGWFQRRHAKGAAGLVNPTTHEAEVEDERGVIHTWKVPFGVRWALRNPLQHQQIVNKYPWYVTWVSPKTGRRMKKYFMSLPGAVVFVTTRAQYVDSEACPVSRHGYDIPPKLRNKIPKPYKWCPCCMKPRRYYRTDETFYGTIKVWDSKEGYWKSVEKKLQLMRCPYCGLSNRDHKFRRSNQPWELRKFKRGVTRAKRRRQ